MVGDSKKIHSMEGDGRGGDHHTKERRTCLTGECGSTRTEKWVWILKAIASELQYCDTLRLQPSLRYLGGPSLLSVDKLP